MLLVNTKHTPHFLIHSPLVGLKNRVTLHYSNSLDVSINRHNNPIELFLKETSIASDIEKMVRTRLKNVEPLSLVFVTENIENIKGTLLDEFTYGKHMTVRVLEHQTKIASLDFEMTLETTIENLQNISEDVLNMFYTVVHTEVADLQCDPAL